MKKKTKKFLQTLGLILIISLVFTVFYNFVKQSYSPYCKVLPINAKNSILLRTDANDCPIWYFEIKTVTQQCWCRIGGDTMRQCGGINPCEGSSGRCDWYGCDDYSTTPINDYGGLLDGYDCTQDLIKLCGDGSTIIEKTCINGIYSNTNNICPIIESKLSYFRFSNNSCNPTDLYLNETTSNDYQSSLVCSSHIIIDNETEETAKTYYRYVNSSNSCVIMNLLINETTTDDYLLNTTCLAKITMPIIIPINPNCTINCTQNITPRNISQIQCYKFKSILQQAFISNVSNCDGFILNASTCGNDYYNKEVCEQAYITKNTCNDNIIICFWNQYWVYISIIATIFSILVSFIYVIRLFVKKKRK